MSSVIAAGGIGKERQKTSTRAAVMRATSTRDGAFSNRLMVGCEHRSRPLSGARDPARRVLSRSAAHGAPEIFNTDQGTLTRKRR